MSNKYLWTVCIIVQYEDKFKNEYQEIVSGITSLPTKPHIRYVLFKYVRENNAAEIITFAPGGNNNKWKSACSVISVDVDAFYNDLTALKKFFSQHVLNEESERHMLVTWGHGQGLGFFPYDKRKEIPGEKSFRTWSSGVVKENYEFLMALQANLSIEIPPNTLNNQTNRLLEFAGFQIKEGYSAEKVYTVSAENLAEILRETFGPRKIEIFIAVNCYMQMLETGYSLQEQIEVFVAPQTVFPASGINYFHLFQLLGNSPHSSVVEIAQNVIDGYDIKYTPAFIQNLIISRPAIGYSSFNFDNVAYSANFLHIYDKLLLLVNRLSHILISQPKAKATGVPTHSLVKSVRKSCRNLTSRVENFEHGFIDLTHFYDLLMSSVNDLYLLRCKKQYDMARMECIKAGIKKYRKQEQPDRKGRLGNPQFLTIFFPPAKVGGRLQEIGDTYFFNKNTALSNYMAVSIWDDFIKDFLIKMGYE